MFDINCLDNSGATPLIWSAFCGCEVSMTYLLAQPGINVNAVNEQGETALHLAVQSPNNTKPSNIVKRLLIKGALLDTPDKKGRTPVDLCRKRAAKTKSLNDTLGVLERADQKSKSNCQKLQESMMIQQPLNLQRKSPKLALSYICLILLAEVILHTICFPYFTFESLRFLKTVTVLSFLIFVPAALFTWYRGPGFIRRDIAVSQAELLERF